MNRYYKSSTIADRLLSDYTKATGTRIGCAIDAAVIRQMLPLSPTLYTEAMFLLEQDEQHTLDGWTAKQSVSRAIAWLGQYPTDSSTVMRQVLGHYSVTSTAEEDLFAPNEYVATQCATVQATISAAVPDYSPAGYNKIADDILLYWQYVCGCKETYAVLSAVVFTTEPTTPFRLGDALHYLRAIDEAAQRKYGLQ